jgi:hypothetical protein
MVIDFRESKVLERHMPQLRDGIIGRQRAAFYILEQFLQIR